MLPAKYWRVHVFYKALDPFKQWMRHKRMIHAIKSLNITAGTSVIDLGGQADFWAHQNLPPLRITILNLPGAAPHVTQGRHALAHIEGDACRVDLPDMSFDIAFSNSVIEHVGGPDKRALFAKEVRRLGHSYWVQTPSIWFPLEPHCGMPFWWFYPAAVRDWYVRRWREKLPAWTEMVEGTTVVSRAELQRIFPDARILVERFCGIPKSYIAIRAVTASAGTAATSGPARTVPVPRGSYGQSSIQEHSSRRALAGACHYFRETSR